MLVDEDCCLATTQMILLAVMGCVIGSETCFKRCCVPMFRDIHLAAKPCAVISGSLNLMATTALLECADEDRRARRRKLGLPEELTEEEKAQEAAAAAQKAEAAKKKNSFVSVKPVSGRLLLAFIQSQYKIQEYCQEKCSTFGTASCSCVGA